MSIKQIAEMTGLSLTTVSHAINGTRKVSDKSLALVRDAIEKTNYRPNLAAQMMKTNRSKTVAIIIPETEPSNSTNCFYFDVLSGAKARLGEVGYDLIVSTYSEHGGEGPSRSSVLQKRWIDGVLLVPQTDEPEDTLEVCAYGMPVVLLDRSVRDCSLPSVTSDNRSISEKAVRLLYEGGRRRIAFVGGALRNSTAQDRYLGYCDALSGLGLPLDEALVSRVPRYSMQAGFDAMRQMTDADADAVFAANSELCLGVVKYLTENRLRIPDKVAVIGFDDYAWTEVTDPPLTAVSQAAYLMGSRASELLLALLRGETPRETSVILPAQLTLRGSH